MAAYFAVQLGQLLVEMPGPFGVYVIKHGREGALAGQGLHFGDQGREFLLAFFQEGALLRRVPQAFALQIGAKPSDGIAGFPLAGLVGIAVRRGIVR